MQEVRRPRLAGKAAVILGASRPGNMGQAIARRFAAEGAKVIVSGRQEGPLRELAAEIDAEWFPCDLVEQSSIDALVARARDRFGRVDIGVNAAAAGFGGSFLETTGQEIDRSNAVLLRGPFQYIQALARAMDRGGSIIMLSTAAVHALFANHGAYTAAKAGLHQAVRSAAYELGPRGIRINTISPGLTATPMAAEFMKTPGVEAAFVKEYPLGRIGTAEDIAAAALFLAEDECFMTGQDLQVNGGLTLRRNPTSEEIAASVAAARG
ncbi:MAG: SDR family oxidoreductase [Caulobacteraceae bacterium]|nr:SDR family oxidoreductase [Caulobacteraceae bacterium]